MFSKFSADTSPTFISFSLVSSQGPIDKLFDEYTWQQYMEDRFNQATVTVAGYNFNKTIGVHFVTLRLKYDIDQGVVRDYKAQIDSLLCGSQEFDRELLPDIDLKRSKKYTHPNRMFDVYRASDLSFDCSLIYGDTRAIDNYLLEQKSIKHLVMNEDGQQLTTRFMLFKHKGTINEFGHDTDSFHKQISKLKLRTLTHFETYQIYTDPTESDEIDDSENESPQTLDCCALIAIQSKEAPGTCNALSAFKKWHELVNDNATRFNLYEISEQPKTELDLLWKTCSKIVRTKGAGEFFAEFRKSNDTSHLEYIEQQQQNTLASSHTLKRIKQKQEKSKRMYFCFELENPISIQACIALSEHLESNDDKFDKINLYYSGDNGQQYLCIYAKADTRGYNRQWFTQEDRKGYKALNNLSIVANQLSYTNEQQFFADCDNLNIIYGDSTSLTAFIKNSWAGKLLLPKGDTITKKELVWKFHAGIRNKTYRSIDDLRDEYEDDPDILEMITLKNPVFEGFINQFVKKRYERLPTKNVIVSLQEFVKKHPLQQGEEPVTTEFLKQKGMYDILAAILEVVVVVEFPKRGTIILHGAPNSGKSSILRIVEEIFICDELQETQGNFDIVPELKEFKFQIVLCHEANLTKMLDDKHIDNTKRFFEREGKPMEGKGKGALWMYKGAANIFASQYFPLHTLPTHNKDAIAVRCRVVELEQSHKDSETFPLNSRLVADWLLRMYQARIERVSVQEVSESDQEDLELTFDQTYHEPEYKPFVLEQAPLLGKRKHQTKTQYNSNKAEKRTKHDISWGDQTTLNRFIEVEQSVPEVDNQLQQDYEQMLPQLKYYYHGKSFPYQLVHRIFQDRFREREFSYYTIKDNKECWKRAQSFMTPFDLKDMFSKNPPYAAYTGAIYEKPVNIYNSINEAALVMSDLVFDIDMDSYDDMRTCCEGKNICDECWSEFIVPSVNHIQYVLTTKYNYKQLLWTFSGGRGVHLRVFDLEARRLDSDQRALILDAIKEYALKQGFELKLDDPVTKDLKRLLRLPFSVHCGKKRLVVPFDPAEVENFKVSEVPTLQQASIDFKTVDRYCNVLKNYFFPLMVSHTLEQKQKQTFKSDDRNPFLQDNEPLEESEYDDIWELLQCRINKHKKMLFWFQVRKGLLQHEGRFELIKCMKTNGVSHERCKQFFEGTMPREKFEDKDNRMIQLISWVYNMYSK